MTHLQLLGTWYVFIGLVITYLVFHDAITRVGIHREFKTHPILLPVAMLIAAISCIVAWPYALYWHYRRGLLRELFRT